MTDEQVTRMGTIVTFLVRTDAKVTRMGLIVVYKEGAIASLPPQVIG